MSSPKSQRRRPAPKRKSAQMSSALGALVFKTTADPFVGKQTYFRVFGGTITSDSRVFNANKNAEERWGSCT